MCPAFEVHYILINLAYNWLRAEKIIGKEDEWGLVTKNHGCLWYRWDGVVKDYPDSEFEEQSSL